MDSALVFRARSRFCMVQTEQIERGETSLSRQFNATSIVSERLMNRYSCQLLFLLDSVPQVHSAFLYVPRLLLNMQKFLGFPGKLFPESTTFVQSAARAEELDEGSACLDGSSADR